MAKRPRHERQRDVEFAPLPPGPFSVILADPPWEYQNWSDAKNGASVSAYSVLRTEDVAALPVADVAGENCALCLWATFPKLKEALQVMESWGFRYVGNLFAWTKTYREPVKVPFSSKVRHALANILPDDAWKEFMKPSAVKNVILIGNDGEPIEIPFDNRLLQFIPERHWHHFSGTEVKTLTVIPGNEYMGIGFYTRKNDEICLLGLKGKLPVKNKSVLSNILSKRRGHSEKPLCQYERIMKLWPDERYLELFARQRHSEEWTVWGTEAQETLV
jgi:N6-adenosine-specific RNA methylase IME4